MTTRRRPRLDPVLAGLILGGLALSPLFLTGHAGALTSWTAQTVLDTCNTLLALRLVAATAGDRYAHRFWRAVAVACGSCGVGDLYQTIWTALHGGTAEPTLVQTGFVIFGMIVAVTTMLLHPFGGTGRQRLRVWLDAATVLTAVAVFLWFFSVAEALTSGNAGKLFAAAATSAVMLLVTFGLLKLLLSGTAPFRRGTGLLAATGVAGTAVATSIVAQVTGTTDPGVLYLAGFLPCLLMPISFRMQALQMRRGRPAGSTDTRGRSSRLPYIAIGTVQLLLISVLLGQRADIRVWGVAVGAVIITGIVLGRQIAAFNDNELLMEQVRSQRAWFRSLVQHSSDLTLVLDRDGAVRYATPASGRVLGVEAEALTGTPLAALVMDDDRTLLDDLAAGLAARPGVDGEAQLRLRHRDGSHRWFQVVGVDLTGNDSVGGVVLNARDVTETRALHDALRHQATHDALTGLANRALLEETLSAPAGGVLSILLIDLDGFKPINDRYGHHAGDEVLISVARRLGDLIPATGLAARLGGDEFAVLLPGTSAQAAAALAGRIAEALARPVPLPAGAVTVGASIGIATGGTDEAQHLLRAADTAMYTEKSARRAIV